MSVLKLYRKRLIPPECIFLKDDVIVKQTADVIITTWNTLKPKISFSRGCSCYFLEEGYKISKFYRTDGTLLYWYCDIVDYEQDEAAGALVVTDLIVDVILYPDGAIQVMDLDELADALESGLVTAGRLTAALRRLNRLLGILYQNRFDCLSTELNRLGL
ncbi:MAG: DUF402 domain-containing protein [Clostridium sp.]|jgi:protein associated with RNAse G/E|nr:DUF402 domain-containing protein [Clostridium sp.]